MQERFSATHRVAIANSHLLEFNDQEVATFKWKDYRAKPPLRYKTMTLKTDEFIWRFLLHILSSGFHRIRDYGLLANARRVDNIQRARARALLIDQTDKEAINEKRVIENQTSPKETTAESV
jgi:hypothetical protein